MNAKEFGVGVDGVGRGEQSGGVPKLLTKLEEWVLERPGVRGARDGVFSSFRGRLRAD